MKTLGFYRILACLTLGGCSTVMEANRPSAVNLDKFAVGEKHLDVVADLGPPASTVKDEEKSCDVYKLYTKGTSKVGKGAIIVTEAAADVVTLGLAEVIATPAEAVSKSNLHTVLFCYSPEEKLVSVRDAGKALNISK